MAKYNFQISYAPSRPRSSRRTATAASVTSVAAAPAVDISGKLDKAEFYRYFEEVNIGTAEEPQYVTRSKRSLFTDGFLSSLGLNPGMGGGGDDGGTTYNRLDVWSDYTSERAGWVLSAALGYELHNRVSSLESNIVPDLSEYATRTWVQQQGYATSAALTAHAGNTSLHVTSSERTLWNRTAADFAAIVGTDSDQIINKWEEVVAFLDTYTEADTLANLLSNKVDKVTGYGLSKNDFTDALLSKLNGIEAGANRYVHPTGGADAAIDDAAGRVLAGITVNALGHVTSVSSKTLAAADIPTLSISKVSGLQDALDGKLDKAEFYKYFEEVNIGTAEAPVYATRSKRGLFSDSFLSAMGLNSSGGGGTGGGSYDRLDLWSDYTSERAGWVLSAGLGYDLYNRVRSLEGGSALSFTDEGTGNVVTAVKKSGTAVVVTKGLTALTSHQPIYALNFQAGAFEAKKYTPNTGAQTVNIPTYMSHIYDDIGYMYHYRQAGVNANDLLRISIAEIHGGSNMPTSATWHQVMAWGTSDNGYAVQLATPYSEEGSLYLRHKTINVWRSWREILDSVNYKSYTVSKTGEGASGTWPIGISGTAANADTVDGYHETSFFRELRGTIQSADLDTFVIRDSGVYYVKYSGYSEGLISFKNYGSSSALDLRFNWQGKLFARFSVDSKNYSTDWKQFAFTDSNVASATKLQSAHTIWGKTFDGTGPVYGDMKDVGAISASGEITTTSANSFRMVYGNYGAFWRNDGVGLYLMLTNAGDQHGTFNSLRPFLVETATGTVKLHYNTKGLTALANGNIGMGTDTPTYKCDVIGVIHSTSGVFSDGYMSAKGINTASDVRLKRRIADVALTVRDVAEAPVYRFAWINGGGIDVGSTAQYWGAKVPELTHLLSDGIHLGLDYGKAALLSVVAVARSTADHERRIADIERQLQNRTI